MDSLDAFFDARRLRIEQFLSKETRSEKINRELSREALRGSEVADTPFTIGFGDMAMTASYGASRTTR